MAYWFSQKVLLLKLIYLSPTQKENILFSEFQTPMILLQTYTHLRELLKKKKELRQNFFRNISKQVDIYTNRKDNIILIGDFNTTLTPLDRSSGEIGEGKSELETLIQKFDLEDNWRLKNPNEELYTHYHGRTNTYSRIDRAYTNTKLRINIRLKHILTSFLDHYHAVYVERKYQDLKRGKGYWILNASILTDDNYKKEIENLWNNWRSQKHNFSSVSQWWETGKKHVRDFTKLYTRANTRQLNKRKTCLEKRLRNLYKKIHKKQEFQNTADKLRSELFQIEL